ncbi:MAG: hypothetical protein AAGA56_20590, partial [Myxococcota bacterium]
MNRRIDKSEPVRRDEVRRVTLVSRLVGPRLVGSALAVLTGCVGATVEEEAPGGPLRPETAPPSAAPPGRAPAPEPTPLAGAPRIVVEGPTELRAPAGASLTALPSIRVIDGAGQFIPDTRVEFELLNGGGIALAADRSPVDPGGTGSNVEALTRAASALSDEAGAVALAAWRLDNRAEAYPLVVRAPAIDAEVTLTATA